MLLLTDSQIVDERMMVPVNDLLAGADVSDLYSPEDRDEVITAMRPEAKAAGLEDSSDVCWALFMQRARANLHIVLTASQVGESLRVRSQRFLATINATVVDWVHAWPQTSLQSVGQHFLEGVDLGSDAVWEAVVDFAPAAFAAVGALAARFAAAERRQVYQTPKSFLEFIGLFKSLLQKKRDSLHENVHRLEQGALCGGG